MICTKCKEDKDKSEFYKYPAYRKYGAKIMRQRCCKKCKSAYNASSVKSIHKAYLCAIIRERNQMIREVYLTKGYTYPQMADLFDLPVGYVTDLLSKTKLNSLNLHHN